MQLSLGVFSITICLFNASSNTKNKATTEDKNDMSSNGKESDTFVVSIFVVADEADLVPFTSVTR